MTPTITMVAIDKIKDNPYRDKVRNPIDQDLVDQLIESIEKTDFWVGVYGRKLKDGTVQLAFGHTRVEAARRAGLKQVPITLQDFSDGDMIMRMARENTRGTLPVVKEAVYAAVQALGAGKLPEFPKPASKAGSLRYAPSFTVGTSSTSEVEHAYTVDSLARFLGLVKKEGSKYEAKNSVRAAVAELELLEKKIEGFTENTVKGKSAVDALAMMSDIKKRHEAVVERRDRTREEIAELTRKRAKIDEDNRKEEKKLREQADKLAQQEREARQAEDEKKAKEAIEQLKKTHERQQKREAAYAETRKRLDAKVAEREERERAAKEAGKDLPTRYQFKALHVELETFISERNPLRDKLKSASRNVRGTANEREIIRQDLIAAGDWLIEQSNLFLPVKPVDVLAEARAKEEAKRKLEESTKEIEVL
jgi:hypothetical protein